jgi:hypothetical protein
MLDTIGGIFAGALIATVVGILVGLSTARVAVRIAAFAASGAWLALIATLTALGALTPGNLGPVPPGLLPFTVLLAFLFAAWLLLPQFRDALLAVPLPALVGVHIGRLGGLFFLLLYAEDRLSAPFAPVAALGDMATAALAIPLAAMLALGFRVRATWLRLWNAFGALDLVVAVSLGLLSAPGTPFRIFNEGPGLQAMATLPWVFVPAMLVPVYLLVHLAIGAKLRLAIQAGQPALA